MTVGAYVLACPKKLCINHVGILAFMFIHCVICASAQIECAVVHPDVATLRNSEKGRSTQQVVDVDLLTSLIEERLALMTDVAHAKWNTGSAIEDPPREQQLLTEVFAQAQVDGIPTDWAQHFFRLQIEAAKEIQYCLFAQWGAQHHGSFQEVPDLKTEIRPKLDHLTSELLDVLAKQWPDLQRLGPTNTGEQFRQSGKAIAIHLALLPLWDGSLQSQDVGRAKRLH